MIPNWHTLLYIASRAAFGIITGHIEVTGHNRRGSNSAGENTKNYLRTQLGTAAKYDQILHLRVLLIRSIPQIIYYENLSGFKEYVYIWFIDI